MSLENERTFTCPTCCDRGAITEEKPTKMSGICMSASPCPDCHAGAEIEPQFSKKPKPAPKPQNQRRQGFRPAASFHENGEWE